MNKYQLITNQNGLFEPNVGFIHSVFVDNSCPWYYLPSTNNMHESFYSHGLSDIYEVSDNWHYQHALIPVGGIDHMKDGTDKDVLVALKNMNIIPEFETHKLVRAGVNCMHKTPNKKITPSHRDFKTEGVVYLYYINDSDGDTILFDEKGNIEASITPTAGSLLKMDSKQYHASVTPVNTSRRMGINLNFEKI